MLGRSHIYFEGKYYTLDEGPARPDANGPRVLPQHEAEFLLARMMRDATARSDLRAAYERYNDTFNLALTADDTIQRWLLRRLDDFSLAKLVLRERDSDSRRAASTDTKQETADRVEAKRIDGLIAELGRADIAHRGGSYRLLRAEDNLSLQGRRQYEATNDREARRVLSEMAQDTTRSARQRAALTELEANFEKLKGKPGLELLVLRRVRVYVVPENQAPAVTPSQIRKQAKKPITLMLVDEWGNPKGDLPYKLEVPAGATMSGVIPPSGEKRHDDLDPGTAQVSLGVHPDDWFPRGAPPLGYLVEQLEISLIDEHGCPLAKRAFTATFQNGAAMSGSTDANGYALLTGTPSYPVTVTFDGFDAEDYSV